jgi:hypothetical protein
MPSGQAARASRPFCAYGRGPIKVTKSRCWNARTVRMRVPSSSGTENSAKAFSFLSTRSDFLTVVKFQQRYQMRHRNSRSEDLCRGVASAVYEPVGSTPFSASFAFRRDDRSQSLPANTSRNTAGASWRKMEANSLAGLVTMILTARLDPCDNSSHTDRNEDSSHTNKFSRG